MFLSLLRLPRPRDTAPSRRAGDDAFRTLVQENVAFVARCLRRLGVPSATVEDATQQVFLVTARKLDLIVPGKERAFLFGTASRVASDIRRTRRRKPEDLRDPVETQWSDEAGVSQEQLLDQKRARAMLDEVLETIPIEYRAVFVLFELEGLTTDETAATLDLPRGTVASRLSRARECFKKEVQRRVKAGGGQQA